MTYPVKAPKKLIEVALPLDSINEEAARIKRKAPGGYPTTLHRWFAQRPLAAARAVIFAQMVNDPSWKWELENPGQIAPNNLKASWAASRKRLFKIIEDLVLWGNTNNETVLGKARTEISKSWREVCELNKDHPQAAELFNPEKLPALHDPFAGGGSIPLEAQRLGLDAYASDLNPVAVLINKALIEIPPKFAGRAPVGPVPEGDQQSTFGKEWPGATGLAEDVRRYGAWMREEAQKRIGHLYPPVEITAEMARERPDLQPLVGQKLTVVAWLWARTVKSPNPAFSHVDVPLVSTFILTSKPTKEAFVVPIVEGDKYRFTIQLGTPTLEARSGTSVGKRQAFRCLISDSPIDYQYLRSEGKAGRMGQKLMAIVADGGKGRIYLEPDLVSENVADQAKPNWRPICEMPKKHRNFQPPVYGMNDLGDLYTSRQLVTLGTLNDLIKEVQPNIYQDAIALGWSNDDISYEAGGTGARAYSEAVGLYLAFAVDRVADYGSTIATWRPKDSAMRSSLSMQALPMTWDFAEGSPFGPSSAGVTECVKVVSKVLINVSTLQRGSAIQVDAAKGNNTFEYSVISTDPPYYNNVSYADLSDYFYTLLRPSMKQLL